MRKTNTQKTAAPRWFAAWRRPFQRPAQDDPADLGTAFGLDLSLQHQQLTDLSAADLRALRAATSLLPAAHPHPGGSGNVADSTPQRGWVQRLGAGRKRAV